jgi:hypothetical protein
MKSALRESPQGHDQLRDAEEMAVLSDRVTDGSR